MNSYCPQAASGYNTQLLQLCVCVAENKGERAKEKGDMIRIEYQHRIDSLLAAVFKKHNSM